MKDSKENCLKKDAQSCTRGKERFKGERELEDKEKESVEAFTKEGEEKTEKHGIFVKKIRQRDTKPFSNSIKEDYSNSIKEGYSNSIREDYSNRTRNQRKKKNNDKQHHDKGSD
jgi:hypothetical protein